MKISDNKKQCWKTQSINQLYKILNLKKKLIILDARNAAIQPEYIRNFKNRAFNTEN